MRQAQRDIRIQTRGRGLYEFTAPLSEWVREESRGKGLVVLHVQHTSASLLIQENADPDVRRDLDNFFARLVPDGDSMFIHTIEGEDDMPAHIRAAITAVNLSIPVASGRLVLGMWQGVYLWEHRKKAHQRSIIAHYIGE